MTQNENATAEVVEEGIGVHLQRTWGLLKKHRWLITSAFVAVFGAVIAYSMTRRSVFEATATIVVDPQAPKVLGRRSEEVVELGAGANSWNLKEYYNTQSRIIGSRAIAEKTVTQYNLHKDSRLGIHFQPSASEEDKIEAAVKFVMSALKVSLARDSRVFSVSIRHGDPRVASDLANYLTAVYVDQNLGLKQGVTRDARGWVAKQLDDANKALEKSETALYSFKVDFNVLSVSFEDRQKMLSEALESFAEALANAQRRRIELEARRRAISGLINNEIAEIPHSYVAESPTIARLREFYAEERRKLRGIEERYGPKHPEHASQAVRVTSALEDLRAESRTLLASVDGEIKALSETEGQFKKEIGRLSAEAFVLNQKEIEYQRLRRDASNSAEIYGQLLRRYHENGLQEQDFANNIRLLDEARAPKAAVEPNLPRAMAVGMVFAGLIAFGLAFLVEAIDRSVKTQEDIEVAAGLPYLGMIPELEEAKTASLKDRDFHLVANPRSVAAECCRVVRTNILFCSAARPLKSMLVTSPSPMEGKTTSAINLGVVMAQSGHRTLLVDADLRRPRLHKAFGLSAEHGLTRLVVGEATFDDSIKSTEVPNLFVLPCGPVPPNPAELLQTERFAEVVGQLVSKYDHIIFDAPPVLPVADPAILAQRVDGVMLVVRAGKTARDSLLRAKRTLAKVDSHVVGVVMNDINLKQAQYSGYYYTYRYRYEHSPDGVETASANAGRG
ncbi:MAG: polysaccharide biosynthesis tyrosine autokinase [Deltaproteobacteria bacterium]|nr:polysaccharide biosynthesis tyrosine autokinase [Deltaproteobacteria bacterium]